MEDTTGRGTTAQAATTDMTLDVWHWNIAGHAIHKGKTNTGALEHAVTSIARGAS